MITKVLVHNLLIMFLIITVFKNIFGVPLLGTVKGF